MLRSIRLRCYASRAVVARGWPASRVMSVRVPPPGRSAAADTASLAHDLPSVFWGEHGHIRTASGDSPRPGKKPRRNDGEGGEANGPPECIVKRGGETDKPAG